MIRVEGHLMEISAFLGFIHPLLRDESSPFEKNLNSKTIPLSVFII